MPASPLSSNTTSNNALTRCCTTSPAVRVLVRTREPTPEEPTCALVAQPGTVHTPLPPCLPNRPRPQALVVQPSTVHPPPRPPWCLFATSSTFATRSASFSIRFIGGGSNFCSSNGKNAPISSLSSKTTSSSSEASAPTARGALVGSMERAASPTLNNTALFSDYRNLLHNFSKTFYATNMKCISRSLCVCVHLGVTFTLIFIINYYY
jgi:hypothetical protein